MEFSIHKGGLGKIQVTPEEDRMIAELLAYGESNSPSEGYTHFLAVVHKLFPDLMSSTSIPQAERVAHTHYKDNPHYEGAPLIARTFTMDLLATFKEPEAITPTHFSLYQPTSTSPAGVHFITFGIDYKPQSLDCNSKYGPDVIHDLAALLGARKDLPLRVAEPLPFADKSHATVYGIAQVNHLFSIMELYGRARILYDKAAERLGKNGVTLKGDLDVLRRDAHSHENLAVRRASTQLYEELLEQLVR
ncbi:MAG: hypothetical protein WC595_04180 [Candidatus Nanoarchaeia archaeon]